MAQNEKVDVVTVGGGLVAGIMAYQLTQAGCGWSLWSKGLG